MPVRNIPKNYTTVTGVACSEKSDDQIGYEGRMEFYFIKLVSFNDNVVSCEGQPIKIFYPDVTGRLRSYIPDFLITFREDLRPKEFWRPLLVEVKPRNRLFRGLSEFRPKFRAARRHVKDTGEDFTIVTDSELVGPYLRSVLFLAKYRNYPIDQDISNFLLDAIRELGNTDAHSLLLKVASSESRRAELLPALWQLVANFSVEVDLEQPLTMKSRISWPSEGANENEIVLNPVQGSCRRKRWQALRYIRTPRHQVTPCVE